MPPFIFRAQPALDLRRREHDAAQRALARDDAERQRVRERLAVADRAIAQARHDADDAARTPGAMRELEWYRFWIVRLQQERSAVMTAMAAADAAVAASRAACLTAHQRCEALERLREKAASAHAAAESAAERKLIDELATRRHAARRDFSQGA